MKKRMVGKLRLDRETLQPLTCDALDRVAGGKADGRADGRADGEITPHCSLPPTWQNCTSRIACSV